MMLHHDSIFVQVPEGTPDDLAVLIGHVANEMHRTYVAYFAVDRNTRPVVGDDGTLEVEVFARNVLESLKAFLRINGFVIAKKSMSSKDNVAVAG